MLMLDFHAEVEDDKKIDARHVIEEAMSEYMQYVYLCKITDRECSESAKALMRNCPKCDKGKFVRFFDS